MIPKYTYRAGDNCYYQIIGEPYWDDETNDIIYPSLLYVKEDEKFSVEEVFPSESFLLHWTVEVAI